ncbi:intercellular adhesion molecule 3-like [Chroicocephalus ridibundus]|uniref:intercellular adhesion molecule 3-like n=1 Tax=Chroicocephalus ridibundus TaxID=1192867 RepID=UPI002FDED27B
MDPCRSWGALALLCLLLPGGHLDPCQVSIAPRDPVVEFGASLLLNCTSSCRNSSRLDWEVPVTKVGTRGPGWVSLSIPNVTDWRLKLYCYGIFGDHRPIAATTIYAYRFSPPQIYLEGDTVAGKETRVTCDVSARVAPPDPPDLRLTLTGGGLPPSTQRGSRLGLVFTARPEQHGREVTCEATLRLGGRTLNASTAATLWVWAAPHHVRVQASRTVFAAGDNLTVTCQAEGNPPAPPALGAARPLRLGAAGRRCHRHPPGCPTGARGHLPLPGPEPLRHRRCQRRHPLPRILPQPLDPGGRHLGRCHRTGRCRRLLVALPRPGLEADAGWIPAQLVLPVPGSKEPFSSAFPYVFPSFSQFAGSGAWRGIGSGYGAPALGTALAPEGKILRQACNGALELAVSVQRGLVLAVSVQRGPGARACNGALELAVSVQQGLVLAVSV